MKKLYSQLPAQGRIPIYFDGLSSAVFFLTPMNLLMATGAKAPKIALVISISFMLIVAAGEMLVMPLHQAPVFLAVARSAVGQIRTATISAGAFRFRWHEFHLDFGHEKSPN